jgi:hypothetical protein
LSDPLPHFATYDDILALPDQLVGEILGGELQHTHPRPSPKHALAYSVLGYAIGGPFGGGVGGPGDLPAKLLERVLVEAVPV